MTAITRQARALTIAAAASGAMWLALALPFALGWSVGALHTLFDLLVTGVEWWWSAAQAGYERARGGR